VIVYCSVEECRHNKDGRCECVWPVGVEAIRIEQTPFGVECMDVDMCGEQGKEGDD
jgi:hypothetical protein